MEGNLSSKSAVRVALIGSSRRSQKVYGPILKGLVLSGEIDLVAVWSRSESSARELGKLLEAPAYTDLGLFVQETDPRIGIVSVNSAANGQDGLMAIEHGLNVLLETPVAFSLKEADTIIAAAAQRHLKIEVAEQFHRRPLEQIKLKLIEAGLFGKVYCSFNDFAGHGYHGVSVMRSYLGFDAVPLLATLQIRVQF